MIIWIYGIMALTFIFVGYALYKRGRGFNNLVLIREVRSGVRTVRFDRAKKIKKQTQNKTTYELQLKRSKTSIPIPIGTQIEITRRGKDFVEFFSPAEDQYYPTDLVNEKTVRIKLKDGKTKEIKVPIVKPIPTDMMLLLSLKTRQAFSRFQKKGTWEMIAPIITIAVTGIIMTIFVYMSVKQLILLSAASGTIAESAKIAAQAFKEASKNFLAAKGLTPPPG